MTEQSILSLFDPSPLAIPKPALGLVLVGVGHRCRPQGHLAAWLCRRPNWTGRPQTP